MADLGEILQNTRLMRGVSLEEAERATHISRRYLQALEAEDFSVFVAPVFARGFLRNYSQYLGLDPVEILSFWPGETAVEPPVPDPPDTSGDSGRAHGESESLRTEFERRSRPLRERERERRQQQRRPSPRTSNAAAPGPLTRPSLGRTDPTPGGRAGLLAAALLVVIAAVALIAANAGGSKGAVSARTSAAPAATTAAGTSNQPRPTQPPPARKAGSMPNLVGKNTAVAVQQLQQVGITPLVISVPSTKSADKPGTVVRQEPAAGAALTTGSDVMLIANPDTAAPALPIGAAGTPGPGGVRPPGISSTVPAGTGGTLPAIATRQPTAAPR